MSDHPKESIVDATIPSAGRIYDYLLGGHHNFEVDRQAAERLTALLPFMPKAFRLQRWCLRDIAGVLTRQLGHDVVIDFASGLPTQDHLHKVVPEGTLVIYSDYDPTVVEYAREILGDTPNVFYFEADARHPEEFLSRPEVIDALQGRRNAALVLWGISAFLTDDELAHTAKTIYEWSGPDSCMVFNAQAADVDINDPTTQKVHQIYQRMGSPMYPRSIKSAEGLLLPWKLDSKGWVSLFDWHGIDRTEMTEQDRTVWGAGGAGYGAYFVK